MSGALLAIVPGFAHASHVSCGDTITQDATLDSDLIDCTGFYGIVIGADDVTLDLNGHTVDGRGGFLSTGIISQYRGGTVKNGVVQQFRSGLTFRSVRGIVEGNITVRRITVRETPDLGIAVSAMTGTKIELSESDHPFLGVALIFGGEARIRRNRASMFVANSSDNRISRNVGTIAIRDSERNLVTHNAFDTPGVASSGVVLLHASRNVISENLLTDTSYGIGIYDFSQSNTIERNIVGDGRTRLLQGILVNGSSDSNLILRNSVTGAQTGLELSNVAGNRIERNSFAGNLKSIDAAASNGSQIVSNDVVDTDLGIHVRDDFGRVSKDNRVERNRVVGPRLDAVLVENGSTGTVLSRNVTNRGRDDGLDVRAPGTIITRNRANNNVDLGIEAVEGVIDGGGNRAFGNGNPLQCVNVACR